MGNISKDYFVDRARVTPSGKILLPQTIIEVMGTLLKYQEFLHGRPKFIQIYKMDDWFFDGQPLLMEDRLLTLPDHIYNSLKLKPGDLLICSYNGAGENFMMRR